MNLQHIINEIEKVDPEVYERLDGRRSAMRHFARFSGKVAAAALPIAFVSMFKKAYAGNTKVLGILDETLNFALTLEYLEYTFYKQGLSIATFTIPSAAATGALTTIRDHELAHVNTLKAAVQSLNATPVSFVDADFDMTAGGAFGDVFSNYDTFLAVAQTFEDTGVRAYKGQAGNLISDNGLLTAALNIHSVEARHASHIRQMRKARGVDVKPWITLEVSGIGPAVAASYAQEGVTLQSNVEITNINGFTISAEAASEAFDEPLTKEQVSAIVAPFFS